jgi:ribosomal protein S8
MAYELVSAELYDKLNDIIMRHELREHYKTHPTSKIIHQILVELDKAGWVKRLKLDDTEAQEGYRMWELEILGDAEQKAFEKIEQIESSKEVET